MNALRLVPVALDHHKTSLSRDCWGKKAVAMSACVACCDEKSGMRHGTILQLLVAL